MCVEREREKVCCVCLCVCRDSECVNVERWKERECVHFRETEKGCVCREIERGVCMQRDRESVYLER